MIGRKIVTQRFEGPQQRRVCNAQFSMVLMTILFVSTYSLKWHNFDYGVLSARENKISLILTLYDVVFLSVKEAFKNWM